MGLEMLALLKLKKNKQQSKVKPANEKKHNETTVVTNALKL